MRTRICAWSVAVALIAGGAQAQTIPDIARTKPVNPIVRGVLRDVTTVPLETLSKEAPLIVVGRLIWVKSYLTADQMNVLSDYAIQPDQVLAGTLMPTQNVPGKAAAPTLTVYGGEVTIDGVTVSAVDHNLDLPKSGQRFLLFLKLFGADAARYQVVRGAIFEVENEKMRSLLKRSETPTPYADVTGKPLSAAVLHIARARQ
jgi:hypothetical protein